MNFFKHFPIIEYKFGNETNSDIFRNITLYADAIDQIRDETSLYEDYTITENERPDQLSFRFYNSSNYYWTFYLMNNKLRESGWPLSNAQLLKHAEKQYKNKTITTSSAIINFPTFFKTGDTISGRTSGATGTITHKDFNLGQLTVSVNGSTQFIVGENIETTGTSDLISIQSYEDEYLAAHHYENSSGEYVDIIDENGVASNAALYTEITILDELHRQNNELKQIRVVKPSRINEIVSSFKEAIRS